MSRLVSDLLDRWAEQPILVIGGGPSVNADLPKLVEWGVKPACVISANAHGAKQGLFPVDLGVNVDKQHNMLRDPENQNRQMHMEKYMRENLPGVPVVNKHSWADYRLPEWRFVGNSGLTAVALACVLGGNPVIVTGIDFWHTGRDYFHTPAKAPRKGSRVRPAVVKRDRERMQPLQAFANGMNVRPMSGPLTTVFKQFDPAEKFGPTNRNAYAIKLLRTQALTMEANRAFVFSSGDVAPPGARIAVTEREIRANPRWGRAVRVLQSEK